jgi:hypothetical protein
MAALPPLSLLPAELLLQVACCIADVDDVLHLRLAARCLRAPGASAVRRLRAANVMLDIQAWEAFPDARGVVIEMHFPDSGAANLAPLLQLLPTLPARLEHVTISCNSGSWRMGYVTEGEQLVAASAFMQRLQWHPCAPRLRHLVLEGVSVLPAAALTVLSQFPSLERCYIRAAVPRGDSPPLLQQPLQVAAFPASLRELSMAVGPGALLDVDAAALAACSGLTRLSLSPDQDRLHNITSAMAACHQLQHLSLTLSAAPEQQVADVAAAAVAHLPQLRSFALPHSPISSQQWQQLVQGLPGLQQLDVNRVDLGPASPPAPQLTSLRAELGLGGFDPPAGQPQQEGEQGPAGPQPGGALLALLPALRQLKATCSSVSSVTALHTALRGHPQLTQLHVDSYEARPQLLQWPQGLLGGIPRLRQVRLTDPACSSVDDLLADAAGCAQLEELEVVMESTSLVVTLGDEQQALMGAGLAALAAGACRHTLRRLVLDTHLESHLISMDADPENELLLAPSYTLDACFTVDSAAQLLQPGALPRLQELQLDLKLQGGPAAAAAGRQQLQEGVEAHVVRRVAQRLEELGVAGAAGCLTAGVCSSAGFSLCLPVGVAASGVLRLGRGLPCELQLNVWLPREERERYGLVDGEQEQELDYDDDYHYVEYGYYYDDHGDEWEGYD